MREKPFRLLCLSPYPEDGPSVRHRIVGYRSEWKAHGVELTLWSFMDPTFYRVRRRFGLFWTLVKLALFALATLRLIVRLPFVPRFDGVIIHRECFPLGPPFFELLIAKLQPNSFYDLDDAIWFPPSNDVNQRKRFWDPERTAKIIAAVRHVVVCNPFLMRYARKHNKHISLIPTTCPENRAVKARSGEPPVIVWIGNLGNAFYIDELLPVLERIAEHTHFTLRLVGGQDVHDVVSEKFGIEHLIWREDMEAQWLRDADVGIMPLVDRPYEQGKCAFKVIQYFAAGLPVVAAKVGMNEHVVKHGENGFLASDASEWETALEQLLTDAGSRERMGAAGLVSYHDRFTREAGASSWAKLLVASSES